MNIAVKPITRIECLLYPKWFTSPPRINPVDQVRKSSVVTSFKVLVRRRKYSSRVLREQACLYDIKLTRKESAAIVTLWPNPKCSLVGTAQPFQNLRQLQLALLSRYFPFCLLF